MILVNIILFIFIVILIIYQCKERDYSEWGGIIASILSIVLLASLIVTFRWQISSNNLTGYIYQRSEAFGYATYDIRYSQGAGTDEQPSFCVESGSEEDKKLLQYLGNEYKATIYIPSNGLFIANNPFECASKAQLKE